MERWQLSAQEIVRYGVIESTIEGYLKAELAAEELCLSKRQVFRLKRKLKEKGIEGIIHGNRGRASPRRVKEHLRDTIDYLYQEKYTGFNISHFAEMLQEREEIFMSRETVRGILLQKGSYEKKKRYPKHRSWREPMPKEGMILQFDTSDHDWLEGRGPRIKLIGGSEEHLLTIEPSIFYKGIHGYGAALRFSYKSGDVTLSSLLVGPPDIESRFRILTSEGTSEIFTPRPIPAPQMLFRPSIRDINAFYRKWCTLGGPHHLAGCYGHYNSVLKKLAELINIDFHAVYG